MDAEVGINYLKSIPGMFKVVEIITALLCFLCAMIFESSWGWSLLAFIKTASLIVLFYCLFIILARILHFTRGFSGVSWNKLDCVCCLISAILLLIAAVLLTNYNKPASLEASVIIGYGCFAILILDTLYKIIFILH